MYNAVYSSGRQVTRGVDGRASRGSAVESARQQDGGDGVSTGPTDMGASVEAAVTLVSSEV